MSQTHPRPTQAKRPTRSASGGVLASLALLVIATAIAAPWIATRLSSSPYAPVVATFVLLLPSLYLWFRVGQQSKPRTAALTALAYAALAAGILWLWRGR
jgi:hypothetical protein